MVKTTVRACQACGPAAVDISVNCSSARGQPRKRTKDRLPAHLQGRAEDEGWGVGGWAASSARAYSETQPLAVIKNSPRVHGEVPSARTLCSAVNNWG